MKYLAWAMMFAFAGSGVLVLYLGLREIWQKLASFHRFERVTGTVVGVQRKTMSSRRTRARPTIMWFPIITFRKSTGEEVKFTSEIGDSGESSRYTTGQQLAVLYDPDGVVAPMLDSWSGVWLPGVMLVAAGLVFEFGAFLISWAFWDKLMGP